MHRKLIFILGFCLSLFDGISQISEMKELFESCETESIITDRKLDFPRTESQLTLPLNWTGEFKGELPMLIAKKQIGNDVFVLRAMNPWNVDSREGFENQLKEWHAKHTYLKMAETDFFMYLDEERSQYRLVFHIDNSKEYENRWIWDFYLNVNPKSNPELICEIKKIVIQFVETYKVNN